MIPFKSAQLIQHTLQAVEVRRACDRPLLAAEEVQLEKVIRSALSYPFLLRFAYYERELPARPTASKRNSSAQSVSGDVQRNAPNTFLTILLVAPTGLVRNDFSCSAIIR